MPPASLKFWNDGKPFDPKAYPKDVASYAHKEADLMRPVHAARAAYREAEALARDLQESKAKHLEVAKAQTSRDQAFAALQAADEVAKEAVLKLQADFIVSVLKGCDPPLDKVLKLTVPEIRQGFASIWEATHDWRRGEEAARPLANGGGISAPSPSPE